MYCDTEKSVYFNAVFTFKRFVFSDQQFGNLLQRPKIDFILHSMFHFDYYI